MHAQEELPGPVYVLVKDNTILQKSFVVSGWTHYLNARIDSSQVSWEQGRRFSASQAPERTVYHESLVHERNEAWPNFFKVRRKEGSLISKRLWEIRHV